MIRRQLAAVQEKTNVSTPLGGVGSGKERDGGMAFFWLPPENAILELIIPCGACGLPEHGDYKAAVATTFTCPEECVKFCREVKSMPISPI